MSETPLTETQLAAFLNNRHDPDGGFYLADLANFFNGSVEIKGNRVVFDVQLPLDQLMPEGQKGDARCVLPEHRMRNALIPQLVFVEADKVRAFAAQQAEQNGDGT